jgi:hypothetical protein
MSRRLIGTVEDLRAFLEVALQLEHATIPVYLTALYSLRPDKNQEVRQILRAVLVEEMLHLTLAANVLNAVGGEPDLTHANFVLKYPARLLSEDDFVVNLGAFSKEALSTFLKIERPRKPPTGERFVSGTSEPKYLVQQLQSLPPNSRFYSIGEFYAAIIEGLRQLYEEHGSALFSGDPRRQVGPEHYYSGGGVLYPVTNIQTALRALSFIIEQGEGYTDSVFDSDGEIAHFYRFEQVALGRYYQVGDKVGGSPSGPKLHVDWDAVFNVQPNAQLIDYPIESELYTAASQFCSEYRELLIMLTRAYRGEPQVMNEATIAMFKLKGLANALVRNPVPGSSRNGAPVFRAAAER